MDLVHVVRHNVLVEGRAQRAVARELGLARVTVRKYLDQAAPVRKAAATVRPRPVWDAVAERVQTLLAESVRWTGGKQRLTATRLHELLLAEGHCVGVTVVKDAVAEWKRQRREVFIPELPGSFGTLGRKSRRANNPPESVGGGDRVD
jgi:transposase